MSAQYALTHNAQIILRNSDGARIPTDPADPDYADYLAWVAAGHVADPAQPSTRLNTADFLDRFTAPEQAAMQAAAIAVPLIGLGLTMGLARGWIDLDPRYSPRVPIWMAMLVSAGVITPARKITIMTP